MSALGRPRGLRRVLVCSRMVVEVWHSGSHGRIFGRGSRRRFAMQRRRALGRGGRPGRPLLRILSLQWELCQEYLRDLSHRAGKTVHLDGPVLSVLADGLVLIVCVAGC